VFLAGPPGAGKTHFGKMLSRHYNVPHILVKEVIDEFMLESSELKEKIDEKLGELRDEIFADMEL